MARPHQSKKSERQTTRKPKNVTATNLSKRRYKPVRRLDDGLLDVARTRGKYFKIARKNQQTSPLLRLAPELRNDIFRRVFEDNNYNIGEEEDDKKGEENANALLGVCRQIYTETAYLPWSLATFSPVSSAALKTWTTQLHPVHAGLITSMNVDLGVIIFCSKQSLKWIVLKLGFMQVGKNVHDSRLDLLKLPVLKRLHFTMTVVERREGSHRRSRTFQKEEKELVASLLKLLQGMDITYSREVELAEE